MLRKLISPKFIVVGTQRGNARILNKNRRRAERFFARNRTFLWGERRVIYRNDFRGKPGHAQGVGVRFRENTVFRACCPIARDRPPREKKEKGGGRIKEIQTYSEKLPDHRGGGGSASGPGWYTLVRGRAPTPHFVR